MQRFDWFILSSSFSVALLTGLLAALATAFTPAEAEAQIAVLSSTVEERVAAPGERYTGTIVISNPGSESRVARIYQTDYRFAADGKSYFDEPGSTPRSNASWITPQATHVVIPAGTDVRVPWAVAVPATDSLRGTYWSTVMVEAEPDNVVERSAGAPAVAVSAVIRYAVQVATHIQSTGTRGVKFESTRAATSAQGIATLDVDVVDAGERGYRPILWAEIYDDAGVLRAQARQSRGLLFPGTSLHQHFDFGALPPGTYKALVFADTGEDTVYAAQYTVSY